MSERSVLQIDQSGLISNLHYWRALLRPSQPCHRWPQVCAVIKANAYGLGAPQIAATLCDGGVSQLCVYSPNEAEEVLQSVPKAKILVLQIMPQLPLSDGLIHAARAGRLHLAIDDIRQMRMVESFGQALGVAIPIHLNLDTGMSRGGLGPDQFASALRRLSHFNFVELAGVFTHMATARSDPHYAAWQADQFDLMLDTQRQKLPGGLTYHLASTFAACRSRRFHRSMARIGLGLYGFGADMIDDEYVLEPPEGVPPLKPVLQWTSSVIHIRRYPAGTSIGYDRSHVVERDSLIGVVPVGYGDGYPLILGNKAVVCVMGTESGLKSGPALGSGSNSGSRSTSGACVEGPGGGPRETEAGAGGSDQYITAPVVGRINMDQMTIDLTEAAQQLGRIKLGVKVQLISDDPQSPCALHKVAEAAQTSCYEIMCRLSPRLPRRYVQSQPLPLEQRRRPFAGHTTLAPATKNSAALGSAALVPAPHLARAGKLSPSLPPTDLPKTAAAG